MLQRNTGSLGASEIMVMKETLTFHKQNGGVIVISCKNQEKPLLSNAYLHHRLCLMFYELG
jgi:hypothetical protein